jgi:hypothetical protein
MEPLSEEFVEKTWKVVAGFSAAKANREMLAMSKDQPDLLAFLMAYTDDLQQEVKELAIYIAFVVYKMFHDTAGKVPKISSREIMARYDDNARFLEGLEGAHEKIIDRIAKVTVSKQPYVINYVLEALMEDSGEDSVDLTDEDIGLLFMLLKTEIEVLDNRA